MNIETPQQANDFFDRALTDEAELRSQVLNNLLSISTYLVSVLDPDELLASLTRRVVEVVPSVRVKLASLRIVLPAM